jgi:hypothetical protein
MAFISKDSELRVGDRIELSEPLEMFYGTFTVGHRFTVFGYGQRGADIVDDEGRRVLECGLIQHTFKKIL